MADNALMDKRNLDGSQQMHASRRGRLSTDATASWQRNSSLSDLRADSPGASQRRRSTTCCESRAAVGRQSTSSAGLPSDDAGDGFIQDEWKRSMQRGDVRRFVSLLRKHLEKDGSENGEEDDDQYLDNHADKLQALDQRLFCALEMIVQEEGYVELLRFLLEIFLPIVQRCTTQATLQLYASELLGDVNKMRDFHTGVLLPSFYKSHDMWPNGPPIWNEIDKLTDVGPSYAAYYRQYEALINILDDEMKKQSGELAAQVHCIDETYKEGPLKGMTSTQSLLRPIQQLPRYRLHLKRLLDLPTSVRNEKYALFEKYMKLDNLINQCNSSIGAPFKEMISLQERTSRSCQRLFLSPHRRLVCHGWVKKLNSRDGEPSSRYLILFSDVLLVCSSSLDNTGSSSSSKLDVVHQVLPISPAEKIYFEKLGGNWFRVYFRQRVLDFEVYSVEQWMDAFCECGALPKHPPAVQYPGQRAPVWEHDSQAAVCFLCARRFQPLYRRHHCRACGRVVCALCSRGKARLEYADYKERLRVCDRCRSVLESMHRK